MTLCTASSHHQNRVMLWVAVLPFVVTLLGLACALFLWHIPLYLGLTAGWLTSLVIGIWQRIHVRQLLFGSLHGIRSTLLVVGILLLIAGVISVWMASGTVPGLIWYGVHLVHPKYLVVSAFVLAIAASMVLGSSVACLSTMGVALVGMAHVFHVSPALMGGALLSGAMVGDRTSPLSGTVHLVANMTNTKVEDNYRPMWQTGGPAALVCGVVYFVLSEHVAGNAGVLDHNPYLMMIQENFHLVWLVLLPPMMVIFLAIIRIPILWNLTVGIVAGGILAVCVQGMGVFQVVQAVWSGYTLHAVHGGALHGGGVWPMFEEVLLILAAGAMYGAMEAAQLMQVILRAISARVHSAFGLVTATLMLSFSMAVFGCSQSISVIVPGRTLRQTYDRMGVAPKYLVQSLSDSGVVLSPLIPWNLHGILCSTAMGIAVTVYMPYAFYLLGLPVLTLIFAWAGLRFRDARVHLGELE